MTDDYLETFIRESEENIVGLNNSLLDLEDDPSDREAVDLIFRTAHTLKGNFGAMGFSDAAELAHAVEDLLDEIREGHVDVTPDVMDRIFAGVDHIEAIVAEIDQTGEPSIDTSSTQEELRKTLEAARNSEQPSGSEAVSDETDGDAEESLVRAVVGGDWSGPLDGRAYLATVKMSGGDMKGVDSMLVLETITDEYELLGSDPDRETIEAGDYDDRFDLLLVAGEGDDVEAFLESISKVESLSVEDVSDEMVATESATPAAEEAPDDFVEKAQSVNAIKSVRVDVGQLDDLYSLVEQLVTSRIKLRRSIDDADFRSSSDNLDELDKITANLQDTVMDMRLIPLRKVVNTFPRLVRDLARSQEKEVDFSMEGTDVELDRTILDEISDPLMHVLRNAVDHGIEPPAEREAAGKPPEGSIKLEASRERDHVDIVVSDDGGGLDADAIRKKAAEKEVVTQTELEAMDDEAIFGLIFHPGFSTSEEITDVSGRGVGMDVVHNTVDRLDGSVSVSSEPGSGTTVTLTLPITVAIVRVLFVEAGERVFGIPIKDIDEITPVEGIKTIDGGPVVDHDDKIYPVLDLRQKLAEISAAENGDGMLLRISESERPVALRCDAVHRQEEVVTKPLEGDLRDVPGMSGTAVVGDGQVVPIIDVMTL